MEQKTRLQFLQELLSCCHNLYYWCYDRDYRLLYSNCPEEDLVISLRDRLGDTRLLPDTGIPEPKPMVMTNSANMAWIAFPEQEDGVFFRLHTIGPFVLDEQSVAVSERKLDSLSLDSDRKETMRRYLRALPVLSMHQFLDYAIMLHFCLTGEKIDASEIQYHKSQGAPQKPSNKHKHDPTKNFRQVYDMEKQMLQMVKEGNLDFLKYLSRMAQLSEFDKITTDEPLRQMKNYVIILTAQFSRAAIEGGLSPELSMTLSDHYIQSIEASSNFSDLTTICSQMQKDYIQRVHRCRAATLSAAVLRCCSHIQLHMEDKDLSLANLAQQLNYSEGYLNRKFKQEIGCTINDYINRQRLERAKDLLKTTDLTIQDISDKFHFCSQSYFAAAFKKQYGQTPSQWRETPKDSTQ